MNKNISSRTTLEKALRINLDEKKYGTIVEIGAGQEVARHFFKTGAAAGTIAKTMSAYDMKFSDAIYGVQEDGRYVSKSRVRAMLEKEFGLILERVGKVPLQDFALFHIRRNRCGEELQGAKTSVMRGVVFGYRNIRAPSLPILFCISACAMTMPSGNSRRWVSSAST